MNKAHFTAIVLTVLLLASPLALAEDEIFGRPVSEINPAWCNASVFPGLPAKGSYSISGRFNLEPIYVYVAVGSYTTCDQKQGTFLLAIESPAPNRQNPATHKILVLQQFDSSIKPTLMKFQGGNFLLFDCDQCKGATLYEISGYPHKFIVKDHLNENQIEKGKNVPYFEDCDGLFKISEFVIDGEETFESVFPANKCFTINTTEGFFSSRSQGLIYYNSEREEMTKILSDSRIESEAAGISNKRFVLISSGFDTGNAYFIFHLTSKDSHSYKLERLISSLESFESGCGSWHKSDSFKPKATSIDSFKFLNEGTANLKISFKISEQDCKTLKKIHLTKTFNIGDESFKESNQKGITFEKTSPVANRQNAHRW